MEPRVSLNSSVCKEKRAERHHGYSYMMVIPLLLHELLHLVFLRYGEELVDLRLGRRLLRLLPCRPPRRGFVPRLQIFEFWFFLFLVVVTPERAGWRRLSLPPPPPPPALHNRTQQFIIKRRRELIVTDVVVMVAVRTPTKN